MKKNDLLPKGLQEEKKKLEELLEKTAETMLAIEQLNVGASTFNQRKEVIQKWINDFNNEEKQAELNTEMEKKEAIRLKAIILLFTKYFSPVHLNLILQDLFINKSISVLKEQVKNINDYSVTERRVWEENYEKTLDSIKDINTIIKNKAFRIFLRDPIFFKKKNNPFCAPTDYFNNFIKLCFEKIDQVIREKKENEEEVLKEIETYTDKFAYITTDKNKLEEIEKENIKNANPNSHIKLDSLEALNNVLKVMGIEEQIEQEVLFL